MRAKRASRNHGPVHCTCVWRKARSDVSLNLALSVCNKNGNVGLIHGRCIHHCPVSFHLNCNPYWRVPEFNKIHKSTGPSWFHARKRWADTTTLILSGTPLTKSAFCTMCDKKCRIAACWSDTQAEVLLKLSQLLLYPIVTLVCLHGDKESDNTQNTEIIYSLQHCQTTM